MKPQCCYEPVPTVYSPVIDCLGPQINPYNPCDPIITPIITPCDIITDPIEIIPNFCYPEVLPIPNVGFGCGCDGPNYGLATVVPNFGCGCDVHNIVLPNVVCGCEGPIYDIPYIGCSCGCDSYVPNCGCGCDNFNIQNILSSIGCGCGSCGSKNIGYELLANILAPRCGCDVPLFPPQNCNCGVPNMPIGINVEPLGYIDSCSCPNRIYY